MFANLFVNPIYWLIAVAATLAWARFATFVAHDVHDSLRKQNELVWKLVALSVLLLMTFLWVLLPSFWIALPVNLVLCGAVIGWYWMVRVQEMGPAGHLLAALISTMGRTSEKMSERRAARSVMLAYIAKDDKPIPLPQTDDPAHAGMTYADQMLVQALERRTQDIEMAPGNDGYDLRFLVDGVPYPQSALPRNVAEPMIQGLKRLAGLALEERRRPQEGIFKIRDCSG
ncbi:MAG: hypothetical protein WCI73_01950, partial [Phycisphaerae bacterium]